jgi:hypothetical protein
MSNNPTESVSSTSSTLTTGAVAGIAVGGALALYAVAFAIWKLKGAAAAGTAAQPAYTRAAVSESGSLEQQGDAYSR